MPDRHDTQLHRSLDAAGDPVTAGWVEAADGSGGRVWADPAAGTPVPSSMVPYYIATGDTFTVPEFRQALFNEPIEVDGSLVITGMLLEVD